MNEQSINDFVGWGIALWIIGYVLGIVLFFMLSPSLIGWVIIPIGIVITLWVLVNKIKIKNFQDYLVLAITWSMIAIVFDYLFIVKMLNPVYGYYKLDVYIYYTLTLVLPLIVGWKRSLKRQER